MAVVYRAHHAELGRAVALKVMHGAFVFSEPHVERFMAEARASATLRHPHIVDVSDVGELDGRPYIVMEYLEGETLAALLARRGRLPAGAVADLALPLVSAVAAAHAAGIVHRDIKPENIFLATDARGGERPVLLDFGISKNAAPRKKALTEAGLVLGTPYYMSPEQVQRASELDGRADQYSLGVTLYELCTGVLPFRSDASLFMLMAEIMHGRPEAPCSLVPELPAGFERVVLRAMATSRDERFASMADFGRALLPFCTDEVRAKWVGELGLPGQSEVRVPSLSHLRPKPSWRVTADEPPASALPMAPCALRAADLRAIPWLDGCSDAELATFLGGVTPHRYAAGAPLFAQGEHATTAFLVVSGQLSIDVVADDASPDLALIGPGELAGQIALIEDIPRAASVRARTATTVLALERDAFERLLAAASPVAAHVQLMVAVAGIRQLRCATKRLAVLMEERDEADAAGAKSRRLQHLRAAIAEWSVTIEASSTARA
ncbi:MAG: protein kinase [Myxococcales bacterium]|nr:protein kinase [Myxococcales bacterium]